MNPHTSRVASLFLALGVFLMTAAVPSGARAASRQGSVQEARDLYDQARYDDARNVLDGLIRAGQTTPEILYYRGLVEPNAQQAAEKYFAEITRRYPSSEYADRARFQIAIQFYSGGWYQTARERFGEVAWRQGDTTLGQAARYWRGMTWTYDPDEPDSLRAGLRLVKAAARQATDPDVRGKALLSTGELHMMLGQPDSALTYAARVVEAPYLADYHARALLLQAEAHDRLREHEPARMLFQAISTRFPDTWEGEQADRWLAQQREVAAQARIDSLRARGDPRVAGSESSGRWTIQVGAFTDFTNATSLVMKLTQNEYAAWTQSKRVEGTLYVVVYVGRFTTRTDAEAFGKQLKDANVITDYKAVVNP